MINNITSVMDINVANLYFRKAFNQVNINQFNYLS